MEPAAWTSARDDQFHRDGTIDERDRRSRDDGSFYKTNVWASGAIIKDRLFFFGMYENRASNPRDIDTIEAWYTDSNNDLRGGKLDWRINDHHLRELLAFSHGAEYDTTQYNYARDTDNRSAPVGHSTDGPGADPYQLTYTGTIPQPRSPTPTS